MTQAQYRSHGNGFPGSGSPRHGERMPNYPLRRAIALLVAAGAFAGMGTVVHETTKPRTSVTSVTPDVQLPHGGNIQLTHNTRTSRLDAALGRPATEVVCASGVGEISDWKGVSQVAADVVDALGAPTSQSNIVPTTKYLELTGGLDGGNARASDPGDPVAIKDVCAVNPPGAETPARISIPR